ncbi:MAG: 3-deoxy-D-manno-octulosonic-acid kinase [Candidatus Accumulibacter sp. BA-94]|uniref:lipopolysaccharide kinase InaA family protein n=1 Tax=Accumulibacter sp. TaxID=2053492 RepID=UPI00044F0AEE|nr:lipopolysaccharide kinase InaA family protein [Accumulibacter sp.]EXI87230.1 MAG: 3-deoxy-D-manno-octulosonic-acid kinase [Candidatus Accumulibacter sp. BA-94]HRD87610.1 lipopolysaccharide kinase InaA family protein [Accumulibacter sp.]
MTAVALADASTLRAAGRAVPTPFGVVLADGRRLIVRRLLRVLPGKRLVGEAEIDGHRVLAKLFIGQRSERHWQREQAGLAALRRAGIPTPAVRAAAPIAGGGHALLTDFLDPVESFAQAWEVLCGRPAGDPQAVALLLPLLHTLGCLHAAGLVHADLHFGNFLCHDGRVFVVDGDALRVGRPGRPLSLPEVTANLAVLLAQLPEAWDSELPLLLPAHAAGAGLEPPPVPALREQIATVRRWRLRDLLAKTVRDCSLFSVTQTSARFTAVARAQAGRLAALVASPDEAIGSGRTLKDGGTSTVARVVVDGRPLLVKRYNLKGLGHALGRALRPSRAWHSWRAAHLLQFLGIPTPAPLALIEERLGPLRRRAWLVSEYCPGANLLSHLAAEREPPAAEACAILQLFAAMHRQRITHGDLKAMNLLWHAGQVWLIDLDDVVQHRSAAAHSRAWSRDRARLLRNWPVGSALYRWLDDRLPAV